MADTTQEKVAPGYPHSRKYQGILERKARKARENASANNLTMGPVCGWEYNVKRGGRPRKDGKPRPDDTTRPPLTCLRFAGAGTNHYGSGYCDYHEAAQAQTTNKALATTSAVRKAREIANRHATLLGDPLNIGPHEALMREVQRSAGIVEWLHEHMKLMKADGKTDSQVLAQSTKLGVTPSVWMQLFNEERKHLVQTCTAAIKAGVQERQVRLAEEQGRMIAMIMMAFVHDPELGLSSRQLLSAPEIIRRHVTNMPRASHETPLDGTKLWAEAMDVPSLEVP
jgi:hypothetical protein